MGMFDGFGGAQQIQLTPKVALIAAMVYISAADGHLDDSETGDIIKIVNDGRALEQALQYCRRTGFQQYCDQAARILSPQQKMCVILNCADMAMGDGYLAPEEQQQLQYMAQYFQIPEAHLHPYIQTLMLKNNISIFG